MDDIRLGALAGVATAAVAYIALVAPLGIIPSFIVAVIVLFVVGGATVATV